MNKEQNSGLFEIDTDYYKIIKHLTNEQAGEVFKALLIAHDPEQDYPELEDQTATMAYEAIIMLVDLNYKLDNSRL